MYIKSRKELEIILSTLKGFRRPKESLEQWQTPSDIAAVMLFEALLRKDIKNKIVIDLGSGTGVLALGAALLGAKKVYGVEIDAEAISVAMENLSYLETIYGKLPVEFICCDVNEFSIRGDSVVMNPPFGLKKASRHADLFFLSRAFSLAKKIYSLHHYSEKSRKFLSRYASVHNFSAELLGTFKFPLKAKLEKHKKPVKHILVDFYYYQIMEK